MRTKKKNTMRSPEEKEAIVLESFREGRIRTAEKYGIEPRTILKWRGKYRDGGIGGLVSRTGKASKGRGRPIKPKSREQELELEVLKLKVEVARLKKGYLATGVGSKKEYVTIKGSNTRS